MPRHQWPVGKTPPSFRSRPPLPLAELPTRPDDGLLNPANSYLRRYTLGPCSVLVTREHGRWHLSISHPARYPTWDEVAEARYRVLPKSLHFAMMLPPEGEYVNLNPNVFQVVQVPDPDPDPTALPAQGRPDATTSGEVGHWARERDAGGKGVSDGR
jgi:hypothetical protein